MEYNVQLMKYIIITQIYCLLYLLADGQSVYTSVYDSLELLNPYIWEANQICNVENGCLTLLNSTKIKGQTKGLGHYKGSLYSYRTSFGTVVETSRLNYEDALTIYKQRFPHGLNGTNNGNRDGVCTAWPVFQLPNEEKIPDLWFVTSGGNMAGWAIYAQGNYEQMKDHFRDGELGGIVVLAQRNQSFYTDSVTMSALTQPMAVNVHLDRDKNILAWGIQGQATHLPIGYEVQVIVRASNHSIVQNILDWGKTLRNYFSTVKIRDPSSEYLGYWTDNGAAYYYNPYPFEDYESLFLHLHNYSVAQNIPFRYLQLDSWWYYKGKKDGVKKWEAVPSVFPNGIQKLHEQTGWPILAHNRYFSSDTDYARQHGGDYPFTIDEKTLKALPLDKEFWDDLFDEAIAWGLQTYEQDWLDRQYEETKALHTNVTLGTWWLDAMGDSAFERNLSIQYCMSLPRHILHSVQLPSVTQVRVSDDYLLASDQWRIGASSLFVHALGLVPFKDIFWSSAVNEHVPYKECEYIKSVDPNDPIKSVHLYTGMKNVTESGKPCLDWKSFGFDAKYRHSSLRENVCGNPEGKESYYCYTKASLDLPQSQWEWGFCRPPLCEIDCFIPSESSSYNGSANRTQNGLPCVDWNGRYNLNGSFCRSVSESDQKPWCYVDETQKMSCQECEESKETNPDLHAAVSSLSAGPVGVGDKMHNFNRELIMKSCNKEGLLLKPSKPLTVTDLYFFDEVELWTSQSDISNFHFGIVFVAEVGKSFTLSGKELNLEVPFNSDFILWQNYPIELETLQEGMSGSTIEVGSCGGSLQFCLLYISPKMRLNAEEFSILGEWEKWVPVSSQRIQKIEVKNDEIDIEIMGSDGEEVSIALWSSRRGKYFVVCHFKDVNLMILRVVKKLCSS